MAIKLNYFQIGINPHVLKSIQMFLQNFKSNQRNLVLTTGLLGSFVSESVKASFGQMSICKGLWECGIMSIIVSAPLGIPVSVVIAYFVFRAVYPGIVTPRLLALVLGMGVVCYAMAVFSVMGVHQLVHVDRAYLWFFNFSAFAAFLLGYIFFICWYFRKSKLNNNGT